MSGFVAMLRVAGAPVDDRLLARLTATLAQRGPDGQAHTALGSVGLGHARLATTPEAARERQPACLGRDLWITGDVRVDARDGLRRELERAVPCDLAAATDIELLLHAYRVWGEACVERVLGDFSFALWDAGRRRLFCARDPFGVKLLYYAQVGRTLIVGNTLASLRAHPDVSDRLDPHIIGDLLLWGDPDDRVATVFSDVRAVPAGHTMTWAADRPEPALRRHWELPAETTPVRYTDCRDPLDHFRALLRAAVDDRLRTPAAAVFMSGGVDSPMIAAVARDGLPAGALTALTLVHDHLVPDRERSFSALAARRLGIPVRHFPVDDFHTSWSWMRETGLPEPQSVAAIVPSRDALDEAARHGRVVLTGWDGDSLLALSLGALWGGRVRRGEWASLTRELAWHVRRRRLPRIGVRAALARLRARGRDPDDGYPDWLRPDFERAQDLRARWRAQHDATGPNGDARAPARRALDSTVWRAILDPCDSGVTGVALEQRHPLLDLRLVRFALSLPPVPWCVDKHLFRAAMRSELPPEVLDRPKTPLVGDPIAQGLAAMREDPAERLAAELGDYVDLARFRIAARALRVARPPSARLAFAAFNTCTLSGWLDGPARRAATP